MSDYDSETDSEYSYDGEIIYCKECNSDIRYYCCGYCFYCNDSEKYQCDSDFHYDIRYNDPEEIKSNFDNILYHRDIIRKLRKEIEDLKSQLKSK